MNRIEENVVDHYTNRHSKMADDILTKARAASANPDNIQIDDLCRYDEMHIGGYHATRHFIPKLGITDGAHILDIGAGVGGPARYVAATCGAHVTGIDLTPAYKETAKALSDAVGLTDKTTFVTGNATNMVFDDNSFDTAYTIHVGTNIQDKSALYREAARVLKNGGIFGIYDTLQTKAAMPLPYPLPWADAPESSFLTTPDELEQYLADAGFTITDIENRKDFACKQLEKLKAADADTPHQWDEARQNLLEQIEAGTLCPCEIICRKDG